MDFKQQVYDIISQFSGQNNVITINTVYVDFTGSVESALLLSQIIYWTDRTTREDGFFYKTDDEWHKEIKISKYSIRKARKKLESMGFLETKIKKANGSPTVHYRLDKESFINSFISFLRNRKIEIANSQNPNCENERTLTEITTKTTTNIDDDKSEPINEISREEKVECNPIAEFEKAFGYLPPHILQQEFEQIIESGQFQEPEAIIVEAIRLARKQMPRNPARYISSILRNFEFMGLFTLDDVKEYNEMFEQKRKQAPRRRQSPTEINWDEL